MSKLLELVPLPYRWLALAALAAALFGYGYLRGYLHEERTFDIFQAQVDVIAKDAARRALERKAAQDQTTKELRDAHATDVSAIRAYYALRLRDAASRRAVPAAPDGARRADGAAGEWRPGDEGDEDVALIELEQRAVLDAEKVMKLQAFLLENGFPVR